MADNLKLTLTLDANGNLTGKLTEASTAITELSGRAKESEGSLNRASSAADSLGTALKGAVAAFGVSEIVKAADAYTALQSQLKLVTTTAGELSVVQGDLNKIANETYQSTSAVAKLYATLQPSMKSMGMSYSESTQFVETFNKALALSSPSISESQAAILQFIQAMGSGILRGDEFNSIMENGRGIAMALADGLHVNVGELRAMAEAGELTADVVVQSIESQAKAVEDKFGKMQMTVSQAWQIMGNSALNATGKLNEFTGASNGLADTLKSVAGVIDDVTAFVGTYSAASKYASDQNNQLSESFSEILSIDTSGWLNEIASGFNAFGLAIDAVKYDLGLLGALMTELATGEFSLMSGTIDSYNENMVRLSKSHEDFDAKLKSLTTTTENYKTASQGILEQERGLGTQLDILASQNEGLGVSIESTVAQVKNFTTETGNAKGASKELGAELGKMQEEYALLGLSAREAAIQKAAFSAIGKGATKEEIDYIKQTTAAIFDATKAVKDKQEAEKTATEAAKKAYKDQQDAAIKSAQAITEAKKKSSDEDYDYFEQNLKAEEKARDDYNKRISDTFDKVRYDIIEPNIQLYRDYGAAVEAITASTVAGSAEQSELINNQLKKLNEGIDAAKKHNGDMFDSMAEFAKDTLKRMDDAFAQTWKNVFDGSQNFGQALKSWFTGLLAELAHMAITRPIMVSIGTSMGLLGVNGTASAAGGVATSASGSFLGSAAAGIGSIGSGISAGFGSAMSMNFAGSNIATSAMWDAGSYGMAVGNAVATYVPYIAAAIALDKLTGGAISTGIMGGSRGERTRDATLSYDTQTGASASVISGSHYDAGWGRSGDWVSTEMLDNKAKSAIESTIDSMATSIKESASKLGYAFNDGLNITASIANLQGKTTEEMNAAISGLMSEISTKLVQGMSDSAGKPLSDFIGEMSKSGEQLYETLARTINQFESFNNPIGRLNDSISELTPSSLSAVDALVQLAGGMGNLSAMNKAFVNAFYTDAQKVEITGKTVASMFDKLGMSIPPSSNSLVDMVKSLDLNTEAGRQAYTVITSNTSLLSEYYKTIDSSKSAVTSATEKSISTANAAKDATEKLSAAQSNLSSTQLNSKTSANDLKTAQDIVITAQQELAAAQTNARNAANELKTANDKLSASSFSTGNSIKTLSSNINSMLIGLQAKINESTASNTDATGITATSVNNASSGDYKDIINEAYKVEFGRLADDAGLAWYTGLLKTGKLTLDKLADTIAGGATGVDVSALQDIVTRLSTPTTITTPVTTAVDYSTPTTTAVDYNTTIPTTTAVDYSTPTTTSIDPTKTTSFDAVTNDSIAKTTESVAQAYERLNNTMMSNEQIAQNRINLESELQKFGKTDAELREITLAGMDSYNQGLQKQLWALQDGAAALSAKTAAEKALNDARNNMLSKLNDLVDSEGSVTRARQAELNAMDESLRSIQSAIYAVSDAKDGLAKAQTDLINATNTEEKAISDRFNQYKADLQNQSNIRIEALQKESTTVSDSINKLKSLQSALKSVSDSIAPKYTNTATDMKRATNEILGYVNSGIVPTQDDIQSALDRVKNQDSSYYGDAISYARDQAIANNATNDLLGLVNKNENNQDNSLTKINDSIKQEQDSINDGLLKLDDKAKIQNAKLDEQLTAFGLLNTNTLSVTQAITNLSSAITALAQAKETASAVQTMSGGGQATPSVISSTPSVISSTPSVISSTPSVISSTPSVISSTPSAKTLSGSGAAWSTLVSAVGDITANDMTKGGTLEELRSAVSSIGYIPAFAVGTNYVPKDMIAKIHEGEMIVPKAFNPVVAGNSFVKNDADSALTKELLNEIKSLHAENIQLQIQLLTESRKQTRLAEKADIDGIKVSA